MELVAVMVEFLQRRKKILRRTPAWLAQVRIRIRIWQERIKD